MYQALFYFNSSILKRPITHTIFLSGSNPERILARLVHSPCVPQKDSCFEINESGIADIKLRINTVF